MVAAGATVGVSVGAGGTPDQSIPNNTPTVITFDTADWNPDGMWSASSPTRVTFLRSGFYVCFGDSFWQANATGFRRCRVRQNGTLDAGFDSRMTVTTAGVTTEATTTAIIGANVGDYAEMVVTQNSGGNLDFSGGMDVFLIREPI